MTPHPDDGGDPRAPLLYRILLHLLPPSFRRRFGRDMSAFFARRLEEAGPSLQARIRVWAKAVADLATHVPSQWREALHSGKGGLDTLETASRLNVLGQELRYAIRSLRHAPGFSALAVLTLALGIGADTAVFSVVDGVLFKPLPYKESHRLVSVWPRVNFNIRLVDRVEKEVPALAAVSGFATWEFSLTGDGDPVRVLGAKVSTDHFDVLGVRPVLGRTFRPEESLPDRAGVAILSHGLWMRRYGGDPSVVGRTLRLGENEYGTRRVIGILPEDFRPLADPQLQVWVPLATEPGLSVARDGTWYVSRRVARLAAGATVERATAELRVFARRVRDEAPTLPSIDEEAVRESRVVPLLESQVGDARTPLWVLLGAAALVLVMACANVANLLLARSEARAAEMAVRRAMGAGPLRMATHLLTEGAVLGAGGGLVGVVTAFAGVRWLTWLAPPGLPRLDQVDVDASVLAFALGTSLLSVLLFASAPVLRTLRRDSGDALRAGGRRTGTGTGSRARRAPLSRGLIGVQVALAVVVVTAAALMVRSLASLYEVDPGFQVDGLVAFKLTPPATGFQEADDYVHYYGRVLERLRAVPDVESAGAIHLLPLTSGNWSFPIRPEGLDIPEGSHAPTANFRVVHPGYFETARIQVLQGRPLGSRDGPGDAPAAVVNRALAERHWPGRDPLGREVTLFPPDGSSYRVVGVVEDVRQHDLAGESRPEIYLSHLQWRSPLNMWVVARVSGPPLTAASTLRRTVWEVDPDVPVSDVDSMSRILDRSVGRTRFVALLLALFAGLALLLGAVGVYGITAHAVERRIPEFGVRMALGAPRSSVLGSSVLGGMIPVLVGLGLGVPGALWASGLLENLLFGVAPRDVTTLLVVGATLAAAGLAAASLPAWWASRLDPARILREE